MRWGWLDGSNNTPSPTPLLTPSIHKFLQEKLDNAIAEIGKKMTPLF